MLLFATILAQREQCGCSWMCFCLGPVVCLLAFPVLTNSMDGRRNTQGRGSHSGGLITATQYRNFHKCGSLTEGDYFLHYFFVLHASEDVIFKLCLLTLLVVGLCRYQSFLTDSHKEEACLQVMNASYLSALLLDSSMCF